MNGYYYRMTDYYYKKELVIAVYRHLLLSCWIADVMLVLKHDGVCNFKDNESEDY